MVKCHYNLKIGRQLSILLILGLFAVPVILFLLPFDYFDHGQSICVSKFFFGIECFGCGMTRACMRIIHGRIYEAMDFNKLSILVFPCLCYLWVRQLRMEINYLSKKKNIADN